MKVQLYKGQLKGSKKTVEGFLIVYKGQPCIILEDETTDITHQGGKGYGPCPYASYVLKDSIKPSKSIEL